MAKNVLISAAAAARRASLAAVLSAALVVASGPEGRAEGAAPLLGSLDLYAVAPLSGLGLNGFDPVSYFEGGAPKPGKPGLEWVWGGVAWRFASEANREAFRRDPETYAPRLGGYDPTALAAGRLADVRLSLFAVSERGLYLFRREEARRRFLEDDSIERIAEARWQVRRLDIAQR